MNKLYSLSYAAHQGLTLRFLVLITQISWAMSARNNQIIDDSARLGVWNKTLQKSIHNCSDFHGKNTSTYFYYWPEGDFKYCCQGYLDPNQTTYSRLKDYRYSMYGPALFTARYYDLGLIDQCFPFWKCGNLYTKYQNEITFSTSCEYRDLIGLNTYRFWVLVVLKYGILASALPLCVFLELVACAAIAVRHLSLRSRQGQKLTFSKIRKEWFETVWKDLIFLDWLHLGLMCIIGNGLVEAVGRQNPFKWESKLFYRFSKLYFVMVVVLWLASLSHQFAQWIAVEKKLENDRSSGQAHADIEVARNAVNADDPVTELKELLQLGLDWKWQPIVAQAAILFCIGAFLTYTTDHEFAATIVGFMVQAASPWSSLYSLRVGLVTLPYIIKKLANVTRLREVLPLLWCSSGEASETELTAQKVDADLHRLGTAPDMNSDNGENGFLEGFNHRSDSHQFVRLP